MQTNVLKYLRNLDNFFKILLLKVTLSQRKPPSRLLPLIKYEPLNTITYIDYFMVVEVQSDYF